jgi:glycosyltransferase involved in cell wall biosynthesis
MEEVYPRLSIITINRNNAPGLAKTIKSVIGQSFRDFEYLVIDGDSTDESVEIIKGTEKDLAYWISEPDTGIYNAMNKGIVKAKGEYCYFLNSGDRLFDEHSLSKLFAYPCKEDIIYWNTTFERTNRPHEIKTFPAELTFNFFFHNTLGHQASIIKKSLLTSLGMYDEKIKYSADWIFYIRAIVGAGCSYKYLDINISVFNTEGFSGQGESLQEIYREKEDFYRNHYPFFYEDYKLLNKITQSRAVKFSNWVHRHKIIYGLLDAIYNIPSSIQKIGASFMRGVRRLVKFILLKTGLFGHAKKVLKK